MSTSKLTEDYIIMNGISHLWQSQIKIPFLPVISLNDQHTLGNVHFHLLIPSTAQRRSNPASHTAHFYPQDCYHSNVNPSSETQGQIVRARESLNGRENMARRKVKNGEKSPLGRMSYQTSSKRSSPFWLLIGDRKLLCFSAQSEASSPMGRFVYPYTEWYMKGSCSLCLSGPFAEALLEMKSSNLSTKFKGFPSDFTLESHWWIRWTFRKYRNSSVFKSLRVFLKHLPIHWCIIWFPLDDIYINVLSRFLLSNGPDKYVEQPATPRARLSLRAKNHIFCIAICRLSSLVHDEQY